MLIPVRGFALDIEDMSVSGFSGYSGYSGESTSGYSGPPGQDGLSGYSGFSGRQGTRGTATSGYSGYSGASASLSLNKFNKAVVLAEWSVTNEMYTLPIQHDLGTNSIIVSCWDESSTPQIVHPDLIERPNADSILVSVAREPDGRFSGRIVILGL